MHAAFKELGKSLKSSAGCLNVNQTSFHPYFLIMLNVL